MIDRLKNTFKFRLERLILRGAYYRLLIMAALIGLVSISAGLLVLGTAPEFKTAGEAVWWAFLRLTDPGYLGDDKGPLLRTVSTVLTVLGYVLFMGSLIAIMTQWLNQTIANLEKGYTPVAMRGHVLILAWTNRTPIIVKELVLSEERVRRFLQRHGARHLRIAILCEQVEPEMRLKLQEQLGDDWNEHQIVFRSGSPLKIDHLLRVDFKNASVIILPGSEFSGGGADFEDMRTIKTLLSISNHGRMEKSGRLPPLVAEIFDARKIPVAESAYAGPVQTLATDSTVSLLIVQNVRHRWLSWVYSELLTHAQGNEFFIRACPELVGRDFHELREAFPRAVPIGVVRPEAGSHRPILNPPTGFVLGPDDRMVCVARRYEDTAPATRFEPRRIERAAPAENGPARNERRILLMGWNDNVPALIREFDRYEGERFEIDVLSIIPTEDRERRMARYALDPERVRVRHVEGDYSAPSDLASVQPGAYDNIVIIGSTWLSSQEEADARTILGCQLLRLIFRGADRRPDVLVELLDPENQALLHEQGEEVLISPLILSHILAHVALRPELNAIFAELFSSGGSEIFFRPVDDYGLAGRRVGFREIEAVVFRRGETALGLMIGGRGLVLNPDRDLWWDLAAADQVVVITTYVWAGKGGRSLFPPLSER